MQSAPMEPVISPGGAAVSGGRGPPHVVYQMAPQHTTAYAAPPPGAGVGSTGGIGWWRTSLSVSLLIHPAATRGGWIAACLGHMLGY